MHEIEVLGHTAVHGPDRTVREPYFPGTKPRQVLELLALGRAPGRRGRATRRPAARRDAQPRDPRPAPAPRLAIAAP